MLKNNFGGQGIPGKNVKYDQKKSNYITIMKQPHWKVVEEYWPN